MAKSTVYFTKEITPEAVLKMYRQLGVELPGKVAVKVHSGEDGNQNFLRPEFMKPVIDAVHGTVVECNTAYGGARNETPKHVQLMKKHGWSDLFDVDIMDAEGPDVAWPVKNGKVLSENLLGKDIENYDSMLVLIHFKGHPMGGYGGALKQLSIGCASSAGKAYIHSGGKVKDQAVLWENICPQDTFLEAMADAAKGIECGMTAVMNLDRDALSKCCEEASALGTVQICNYNCPGQLVIGGEKAAVDKAAALAKEAGARRCIPLKVSGPFHTRLMAPAGDALAKRFASEPFGEMQVPVLFNCLGREKADADSIPALLVKQVQSSVYMEDTLHRLGELGVDHILEVGPGSALAGFVKKTLPGVVCASVETPEQLSAALTAWKEEL